MREVKVLLADQDESYILQMEKKVLDELGANVELHVVTDPGYMRSLFSTPQSFDVALVEDAMLEEEYLKHSIGAMFALVESGAASLPEQAGKVFLDKYISVKELYAKTIGIQLRNLPVQTVQGGTRVVLVYAPAGGAGQTTVAAGLCASLASLQKRTLFLGLDTLQSFGDMIVSTGTLAPGAEKPLVGRSDYVYEAMRPFFVNIGFDVLPPLGSATGALGITTEHFVHLVDKARASGDYDYIVLDAPRDFTPENARLMAGADKMFIVTEQAIQAVQKLERLLSVVDISVRDRFCFVCNKYRQGQPDATTNAQLFQIDERLYFDEQLYIGNMAYIAANSNMQTLALRCI